MRLIGYSWRHAPEKLMLRIQPCLLNWGDFESGRNLKQSSSECISALQFDWIMSVTVPNIRTQCRFWNNNTIALLLKTQFKHQNGEYAWNMSTILKPPYRTSGPNANGNISGWQAYRFFTDLLKFLYRIPPKAVILDTIRDLAENISEMEKRLKWTLPHSLCLLLESTAKGGGEEKVMRWVVRLWWQVFKKLKIFQNRTT